MVQTEKDKRTMVARKSADVDDNPTNLTPADINVAAIEKTADERLARYRAQMNIRKATAWMPAPNTTMYGVVVDMGIRDSGWGEYPVITYKMEDGSYTAVHAFHTLARTQLEELKCAIGQAHFLTYLGVKVKNSATDEEREAKRDRYHDYDIADATTV